MRRAHADLAGLAWLHFLVVVVEDLTSQARDREAAGREQLRPPGIVVVLAQHARPDSIRSGRRAARTPDRCARALRPAGSATSARRRRAISSSEERSVLLERGMIEQHVDHRRHEQREVDPLARDRRQHRLGIETLQHVHRAAAHQRRQHLGAGDMADRGDREIARCVGDLEVGDDRAGSRGILAVIAQRALGFACRAAGVVQRGEIVETSEAPCAGMARALDRRPADRRRSRPGPW